mmetsp:Transcript_27582/g.60431  ORF Transcript_27582/g.60431 Transcript_27582/m.60431 type:complete len:160 (-) Transcript_27582:425-904(-)
MVAPSSVEVTQPASRCHPISNSLLTRHLLKNIRMNVEWVEGMPRVYVQFGCEERQWFVTTFNSNEAGGMDAEELLKYFEINVFPLYPDAADVPGKRVLIKIDGGPGRLHFSYAHQASSPRLLPVSIGSQHNYLLWSRQSSFAFIPIRQSVTICYLLHTG